MKVEFDLEITDQAAAAEYAAGFIRKLAADTEAQGGKVEGSSLGSPEQAAHQLAQEQPRTVASLVVREILGQGADRIPWAEVSNATIANEPLDG